MALPESDTLVDYECSPDAGQRQNSVTGSRLSRFVKANAGFLFVASAQAFFALKNVAVKSLLKIEPLVSTLELVLVRMVITYLLSVAYIIYKQVPDPLLGSKAVRPLLVARGLCGFVELFCAYYSLRYLSISDLTALFFLAPLSASLVFKLCLGERFDLHQAFAGVISLGGVILIAQPEAIFGREPGPGSLIASADVASPQRVIAVGVALLNVLSFSGAYMFVRAIGDRAHPMHPMLYLSMCSVIISGIGILSTRESFLVPADFAWLICFLVLGIFGFSAQMLMTLGFRREEAGRSALGIYMQIVFALVLEWIFFHITPSMLSAIGIAVVMTSSLYITLMNQSKQARTDHSCNTADAANAAIVFENDSSESEPLLGQRRNMS